MKNGKCPNCDSPEIYASLEGGGVGDGFSIHVLDGEGMVPTRKWQTLLCGKCGYYENYLLDEAKLEKIAEDPGKAGWKKIS